MVLRTRPPFIYLVLHSLEHAHLQRSNLYSSYAGAQSVSFKASEHTLGTADFIAISDDGLR